MKKIIFIIVGFILSVGILYAIDTFIVSIPPGQVANTPGSSNTRIMTVGGNPGEQPMKLINKDNDSNVIGDYFTGYYYDPAHGSFQVNFNSDASKNVRIASSAPGGTCAPGYDDYKLAGYAYNPDFGYINFSYDTNNYVYICVPEDSNDDTLVAYLGGYACSVYIGCQNFDGIKFDASVDLDGNHDEEGRYLKVDGITSSENFEAIDATFEDEVRVIGNITKATARKNLQSEVYKSVRNITSSNGSFLVSNLGSTTWGTGDGAELMGGKVLYFGDVGGSNVIVGGNNSISGEKTLVVEGGNIYITGDIRGSGVLGIIALEKGGLGGNIYIDPDVTDIHAIMYADRSLVSYNGIELDGSTQAQDLAKQLYIYGSVFSENTIGGSLSNVCPYYINSCDDDTAKKFDLNYLRRYILVQPVDADGNPVGDRRPQFSGGSTDYESYMGDTSRTNTDSQKPGYRKFPIVIEYNPKLQQTPPPFF